jgi:hypothetical protein
VFVRQGAIVPEQASSGGSGPPRSLTALVYPGSSGSFELYGDAGAGLGYTEGQRTETRITTSSSDPALGRPSVRVTIAGTRGSYRGEPTSVATTIDMVDVTRPDQVAVNGRNLSARGTAGRHWSYQSSTSTLTVDLGSRPVGQNARVLALGATALVRGAPRVTSSTSS